MVLLGFLAVGGFYLIAEHTAHLVGAGPLLLLLLLSLGMHAFMHGGHSGHGGDAGADDRTMGEDAHGAAGIDRTGDER